MSAGRVKPGDLLGGKYRVEQVLGAGGMGIVVAATHIELHQRVALKFMLKEAMADPSHAERFLREAKAAAQLKSIHTARVLDMGRLKNDEPFMVMEYLDGCDLDAELHKKGPLPPHIAVDYILQAGEALAEAHTLGMVHRDVKLKNMYLTATVDGRPLVKVLDFGLAKQLGANRDVSLTATNSVFGSPQYMSPEQMKSAKDVDFRSDIWSLGVCLYELLTGRVPFDANGVAEICAMVLKDPVPPPSQFIRGLPVDLEDVVLRCLEKDVTRRYQSVAELAFALQGYAADEGSARRILHVMQTAQKLDHPTIVTHNVPGPENIDAGPKTMNGWDSNLPTRRTTQLLSKPQVYALMGLFFAFVCAGAAFGVLSFTGRKPASFSTSPSTAATMATTASVVADPGTATTSPLPPPSPTDPTIQAPPPTTPVGVVIGASPTTTDELPTTEPTNTAGAGTTTTTPKTKRPNTGATKPPPVPPSTPTKEKPQPPTGKPKNPPGPKTDPGDHM